MNKREPYELSYPAEQKKAGSGQHRRKKVRKQLPGYAVAILDFVLVGASVCMFALFHHVLPRKSSNTGIDIPRPPVSTPVQPNTSSGGESTQPVGPSVNQGQFGAKFADKFTDSVVKTDTSYSSKDISVTLTKHVMNEGKKNVVTYFVADIYIRNIDNFRTAFANDEFGHGYRDDTVEMAKKHNAVVALSGDYYGIREQGVVIRNGKLYRDTTFGDVCVLFYDGTMKTYSPNEFNTETVVSQGAYQAWSFGPKLLDNGQVMETFNSDLMPANPRAAIGYYEPGHYAFVMVDGRQAGYSTGLRMEALSQLFYDLGCKEAYNLDGGQSAVMAFDGKLANQPYGGGRSISDILYIGEVE